MASNEPSLVASGSNPTAPLVPDARNSSDSDDIQVHGPLATEHDDSSQFLYGEESRQHQQQQHQHPEYASEDEDGPDDHDDTGLLLRSEKGGGSGGANRKSTNSSVSSRRSSIGSLHFDFSNRILLSSSSEDPEGGHHLGSALLGLGGRRKRAADEPVGLATGIALIVGMIVGSGIFSSPGVVARETGSTSSALLLWTGAGLLSWAGASSFAELGTALPLNGGAQAYLDAAYGPLPAYCFSFTAVTALKPGSQAIIAIIFGEYLCRLIYHTAFSSDPNEAAKGVPVGAIKAVAVLGLFFVSGIQAWSSKAGTRAQLVLTIFKVFALVFVFVGGLVFLGLGRRASSFSFEGSSDGAAGYALALFSALWTFDGFDQCNYVAKDCKGGALPIIIHSSMALVVSLFVCVNVSYFIVLPLRIVTASSTIGLDFGRAIAGPAGAVLLACIVSISCLGALNGGLYTSARLVVAASEQGFLPRVFSHYNDRQSTPINGIALTSLLSVVFILLGDFAHLTLFYGVCAWTWNFLVVVGLLVLRVREPSLKRPYRTFLATPILFASTALFLIVLSCFSKPWESLAAFGFCGAGVIPFWVQQKQREKQEHASSMVVGGHGFEMS